jgi:peptidoglycan-associated lipoprotein
MRDYLARGGLMKSRVFKVFAVAFVVIAMALFTGGCAKQQMRTDEGVTQVEPMVVPSQEREERRVGLGDEEPLTSDAQVSRPEPMNISEGRTHAPLLPVYFDFDSSAIRADQQPRLERNAAFLRENPQARIRIEGNCDERGTSEYNMALGERRAMSAKNYLVNLGIAENRITIISYGEEKPLVRGQNENAWTQNRRDDFVITSR